jgi:pimeloyl-ACP methyl ester carboxylesterase
MSTLISRDGTVIAYETTGSGPPVVLVDGAFGHRGFGPNPALAKTLASEYRVISYDRRGRGGSSDPRPWAHEREVEDLAAVIDQHGGEVALYAISSGVPLALEAASRLSGITRLALYEAPFILGGDRPSLSYDYVSRLDAHIAAGDRGAAVKQFLVEGVGLPAAGVAVMRLIPAWRQMKSVAHTLPYDARLMIDNQRGQPLDSSRWGAVRTPILALAGGKSPAWIRAGMVALAESLPNARYQTLEGQTHLVKAKALAPVLSEFYSGATREDRRQTIAPAGKAIA